MGTAESLLSFEAYKCVCLHLYFVFMELGVKADSYKIKFGRKAKLAIATHVTQVHVNIYSLLAELYFVRKKMTT